MRDWPIEDLGGGLGGYLQEDEASSNAIMQDTHQFISSYIDSLEDTLWPINLKIHDNPEICHE
jgi:hypothetical protein